MPYAGTDCSLFSSPPATDRQVLPVVVLGVEVSVGVQAEGIEVENLAFKLRGHQVPVGRVRGCGKSDEPVFAFAAFSLMALRPSSSKDGLALRQ
jgi:hypothetical protein